MPVHKVTVFYAACDECTWVSANCQWSDMAEDLLDNHIATNH